MKKRIRLTLTINVAFLCMAFSAQADRLYISDSYYGPNIIVLEDGQLLYSWERESDREYAIYVDGDVFTMHWNGWEAGSRYNQDGTFTQTFTGDESCTEFDCRTYDAATDGYAVFTTGPSTGVYVRNRDYTDAKLLFTGAYSGVTYDPNTDTLWVCTANEIQNRTFTGDLISSFPFIRTDVAAANGLAMDYSDGTLWTACSAHEVAHYQQNGTLLGIYNVPGSGYLYGGMEFDFAPYSYLGTRRSFMDRTGGSLPDTGSPFIPPSVDTDGDGIEDNIDNCPFVSNADQNDTDGDGIGDVCDTTCALDDSDGDGIIDQWDRCSDTPADTLVDKTGCAVTGYYTQAELDQAVMDAEAAKDQIIAARDETIQNLKATIASMYTQEQLNQAVSTAEAAKDVILAEKDHAISDLKSTISELNADIVVLNAKIASMYTQEQLDQAVLEAETAKDEIIEELQSQLTEADATISDLTESLQAAFDDPEFSIPGENVEEQIENLVTAIEGLNHGQLQALYENLRGTKDRKEKK